MVTASPVIAPSLSRVGYAVVVGSRLALALVLASLAGFAPGCCSDAGDCPATLVVVHVSVDGAAVDGVTVEGGPSGWSCEELESETLCRPETLPDGVYPLVVTVPGFDPEEIELTARTYPVPSYSCDCAIPSGDATVELERGAPPPDPDAGTDDAG
jgi:hypothetical protein